MAISPSETFLAGKVILHGGDNRTVMKGLAANSIDSVVTDPPYALVSIVKRFGREAKSNLEVSETKDLNTVKAAQYKRLSGGFMGLKWDTGETAFAVEFWAEILRVLKPGGHVVSFSGTRTYHRMACAIEDAGFEIRDQIGWLYGSGFPKSHNASNGWGTALKPAWEPICFARKPLIGTVAANVMEHGTGAINIDGCRVEASARPAREVAAQREDVIYGGNALMGRVDGSLQSSKAVGATDVGRWPANIVHDGSEEVLAAFPDAPGQQRGVGPANGEKASVNVYGDYGPREQFDPRGDSGSTARFFYTAKADAEDRSGSKHPTVKPVDLMQWLVRLVTPKGGTVLDPFAGTGSTGEAAWREGMKCVLIEREPEYLKDIRVRLSLADAGPIAREHGRMKHSGKAEPSESLPLFEKFK